MARPTKNNAEYFSHDAGMRNDPKIRALRKRFPASCGACGYSVYNMLLEVLTDAEFFTIEVDEVQLELLAGDFDIDAEILSKIIEFCVKIKLISQKNSTISSCGLNKRLQGVIDKRNRSKEKFEKQKQEKISVSVAETTQSKVKYSKVKESKDNYSHNYPSTANADDSSVLKKSVDLGKKIIQDFEEIIQDFEEKNRIVPLNAVAFPEDEFNAAVEYLKTHKAYRLLKERYHAEDDEVCGWFKIFYEDKEAFDAFKGKTAQDIMFNFKFWVEKRIDYLRPKTQKNGNKNKPNTTSVPAYQQAF